MTRFAVDAPTTLRLVQEGIDPGEHQLVGTASLRSEVLSLLYREQREPDLGAAERNALLDRLAGLRMRLLGDRVSRREAWRIASELQLDDTRPAELIAVARLQADVLVTDDEALRSLANGLIEVVGWRDFVAALS
ncbi:type II toxin-antitoxin system VapC family toxin [Ornithinimicrobium ciconiae]|uniref:Type II toxin-antitoxin system VapC family toxin n=1 Tax=Ornithinimicrobium ciconiae TaxID=2594265 RepID=A0A516G8X3_9MICO|nr:type II toxin-antitoxin system VapC family toxin [Ornithinimicrobium ciconiae]QDO87981.1 type II toxin-antitoxin system VapC family toxin [Ornithinimicrobium ciconiae]